jgi:hypothetical protein
MQRITALWNRDRRGKVIVGIGLALAFLAVCCVVLAAIGSSARPAANATSVPVTVAAIIATEAPAATKSADPTVAPTMAETADDHYLSIARSGALPTVRGDAPKGAWVAKAQDLGQGPEVRIEFPMTIGFSAEQTTRQAKLQGAGIIKRLFDADPALMRVNVIGTLPDGPDNAEQAAVSIVIERAVYAAWDGNYESLSWNVSQRLK